MKCEVKCYNQKGGEVIDTSQSDSLGESTEYCNAHKEAKYFEMTWDEMPNCLYCGELHENGHIDWVRHPIKEREDV